MNAISTLQNLLGVSRPKTSEGSCLQLRSGVIFEGDESGRTIRWPANDYWILGRELLLFDRIDLSEVPKNHQSKVLEQKTKVLSPFEQTGQYIFRDGNQAMVWIWDEAKRREALDLLKVEADSLASHFETLTPLPESVLQASHLEGQRMLEVSEGFEQQDWGGGSLLASRWLDGAENANNQTVVEPWTEKGTKTFRDLNEEVYWRLGLLVLGLVLVFQLGTNAGLRWEIANVGGQLQSQRAQVQEVLELRQQVMSIKKDNELLSTWLGAPHQISILAEFDELLPTSAEIIKWEYQDAQLKVTIQDEQLDNRLYVERLSEGFRFTKVGVEPGIAEDTAVVSLVIRQ